MFDIYTIIFLALAIFIFIRLRSVLGQRTGRERPPYDPYSARDARAPASDKVVTLPTRNAETGGAAGGAGPGSLEGHCRRGQCGRHRARRDRAADRSFDAKHFVTGARGAYEMIVGAFAAGDRKSLKGLLSREVYDGFEAAIRDREAKGETVENKFVSLDTADIIGAELRGNTAQVTDPFRVAADLGDARQGRQRDRRQPGQGDRSHRRVDLRARRDGARSELEAGGDRSGTVILIGGRSHVRHCGALNARSISAAPVLALAIAATPASVASGICDDRIR